MCVLGKGSLSFTGASVLAETKNPLHSLLHLPGSAPCPQLQLNLLHFQPKPWQHNVLCWAPVGLSALLSLPCSCQRGREVSQGVLFLFARLCEPPSSPSPSAAALWLFGAVGLCAWPGICCLQLLCLTPLSLAWIFFLFNALGLILLALINSPGLLQ